MKKVFIVSLLLIGVFLIGSSGVALAQCQQYQCTGNTSLYGVFEDYTYDTCVALCPGDPYFLWSENFSGYLYPIDTKNFLGTAVLC